ncbi:hypothetical protein GOODEAATRI_015529, partial [Goodea atripinnis]
ETELKDCLLVLVEDQQKLSAQMAKSTLSAQRLRQRLVILERYLISLSHSMMEEKYKVRWKTPPSQPLPAADNKSKPAAGSFVRFYSVSLTPNIGHYRHSLLYRLKQQPPALRGMTAQDSSQAAQCLEEITQCWKKPLSSVIPVKGGSAFGCEDMKAKGIQSLPPVEPLVASQLHSTQRLTMTFWGPALLS